MVNARGERLAVVGHDRAVAVKVRRKTGEGYEERVRMFGRAGV